MGEIGIPRADFLYRMRWWEIQAVERGYNRRHRQQWSTTRWQTYHLMAAFAGTNALNESGIHSPVDLFRFPWEREPRTPLTDADRLQLQADMAAYNSMLQSNENK